MATKKKTEQSAEPIVNEVQDEVSEIDSLKEQIAKLQAMLSEKNNEPEKKSTKKAIKFVNLGTGTVILKGTKFWEISGQFSSRMIPEAEARAIVSNSPNLLTSGMICVPDAEFLADYDIDVDYDGILNEKQLRTLLTRSAEDIAYIYNNTSDEQKRIIVNMIIDRRHKNQYVDANVIVEISKLCGKDLSQVEPMDEE